MSNATAALAGEAPSARRGAIVRVAAMTFLVFWVVDSVIDAALSGGGVLARVLHPTAVEV